MKSKFKMRIPCLVYAYFLISLVNTQECPGAASLEPCVKELSCPLAPAADKLDIWEDCNVGDTLFTVNDPNVLDLKDCTYLSLDGTTILLAKDVDTEVKDKLENCYVFDNKLAYVTSVDVNEFDPQPDDGNRVVEVEFEENKMGDVITLKYSDEDFDEYKNLKLEWVSTEFEDRFKIDTKINTIDQLAEYTLSTREDLDFEERSFYKLVFTIISEDLREGKKSTNQTVLLSLIDLGDTAPYWITTKPSASIDEGPAGRLVYQVEAADRDLDVNNEVRYSITSGNDDGFFKVDLMTGEVTVDKEIDHELGNNFFTLEITAQEYIGEVTAPEPSSAVTITNLNILDINDEIPTFNQDSYNVTMDEVVDTEFFIDVEIFVSDEDSDNQFNRYTVTADPDSYMEISPPTPRGNTSIQLKVLARKDTIFDYETATLPIVITLTATETDKPVEHYSIATLNIMLNDRNDFDPVFESETYTAIINEDEDEGYDVVTVNAEDGDKSPEFGKESIIFSVDCPTILNVDRKSGVVTLNNNALDYEDQPVVTCAVFADDVEGGAETRRATSTITITVNDINDSPPSINVTPGQITENSVTGTTIPVTIEAADLDTTASLDFDIDWDNSQAYKDGGLISIDDVREWFEVLKIDGDTAKADLQVGATSPDREVADRVTLSVRVTDKNTAEGFQNSERGDVEITIIDENDTHPVFNEDYNNLNVSENSLPGTEFATIETSDADENDQVTFSIDDLTYVNIVPIEGTGFSAKLVVSDDANIDREQSDTITVTITVTDANNHDTSNELVITVVDENDNPPIFDDDVIFASFTANDKIGQTLLTFKAKDADLNEILGYQLENDFEWPSGGPEPPPLVPFRVQTNEIGDAILILNFDPLGILAGYCTFTIDCLDNDGIHNTTVQGKVYAITTSYQISVFYNNPVTYTTSQRIGIVKAFSDVYGHPCIIDSIEGDATDNTMAVDTKSVVKMHFIDEDKNEPIQAEVILEMTNDQVVTDNLRKKNDELGLDLQNVGDTTIPESAAGANQVLMLQILLGVVSLVMGSFLLLILIVYFLRTKSLERKLKVANTTTFGSVDSGLNRMDLSGVPGCNKFAGEGANPMYNISDADLRNDDGGSIGSGDSVLVGVEDNPEFRGHFSAGQSNPAFNRSIDDVDAQSPFGGGTRTNPLMEAEFDENDGDVADALQNFEVMLRRESGSSGVSEGSSGAPNPNFSFGNKI